jgi:hypothetical protein
VVQRGFRVKSNLAETAIGQIGQIFQMNFSNNGLSIFYSDGQGHKYVSMAREDKYSHKLVFDINSEIKDELISFTAVHSKSRVSSWPCVLSFQNTPVHSRTVQMRMGFGFNNKKQIVDLQNSMNALNKFEVTRPYSSAPDLILAYQQKFEMETLYLDEVLIDEKTGMDSEGEQYRYPVMKRNNPPAAL